MGACTEKEKLDDYERTNNDGLQGGELRHHHRDSTTRMHVFGYESPLRDHRLVNFQQTLLTKVGGCVPPRINLCWMYNVNMFDEGCSQSKL